MDYTLVSATVTDVGVNTFTVIYQVRQLHFMFQELHVFTVCGCKVAFQRRKQRGKLGYPSDCNV